MTPLLLLLAAQAASPPPTSPFQISDPRIRELVYDPRQVVPLTVGRGYAAVIELGQDQVVESVIVGDSAGWEVTASKRGDHVVVKPLDGAAPTDMVVITGDRRYVFLIEPGQGATSFVLSFVPAGRLPVPLAFSAPEMPSTQAFRFAGDRSLYPATMRSDGQRTMVSWTKGAALPAIFAVEDGHEAIVNGRMVGGDYVIEGTAEKYVFRLGKRHATAVLMHPKHGR